ncbi:K02A2.6-like [Cordylochernes scorpioides]|uniref:RNA-directed DNA polymerase n=1 Tax=Cordylochernes scorpioides TaxID=51811 RepID=A0ABY6LAJ4_9ARAC|nr:K02A2.6-like [Cordylochernes scorpioides]
MPFKIDTGADVSVMPENCFKQNFLHQLGKTQKRLHAAGMAMPVLGNFQATLEANGKVSHEEIYVIKNFPVSLLSAKASEELGFIQRLLHVNSNPLTDPLKDYPELFSGLGKLNKPYKIELNDQAQPYAIHTHTQKPLLRHTGLTEDSPWGYKTGKPMKVGNKKWRKIIYIWRIPFPLMNKTKQKLKEMEQQGVIEKVDHATDWCSPMIIAYASRSLSETERKYAQIEKEALALTWAMDKFKNYIISLEVELETDHKPLISIFSTKALEDLSPRIQRMKLRMMRYSFKIKYIPGKKNILADVLSCAPRNVSDKWIKEIAVHQSKDPTIQRVKSYVQDHWPDKSKLSQKEVEFWHVRNDLIIINNLLMKGSRYVVPGSLRSEILSRIHEGHQGVTKCRRMRESFYWPKSYKDVEQMVLNCNECIKKSSSWKEPIIMTGFSDRPWKEVAMDLCQFEGKHFLVITDYYSCYPEFSRLDKLSAETVILHTKSIFAGHGIPKLVRMDNGLQFKNYLFQNFEKESSVKMIKARLKKSQDPYLGLLAYRTTPLENGFSPSELLMGRKLRTDLPTHPDLLKPTLVNQGLLNQKEHKYRC